MEDIINKYVDIALSDKEVLDLVHNRAELILYPDIYKYSSIDDMLGPHRAAIILFEAQPNYGHWVALFNDGINLEFFNSYGGYPDDTLKFIDKKFRVISNQDKPYLSYLMMNSPYILHYNQYPFQKHNKDVKTCGRHAALRLVFRDLTIDEYKDMFDYLKDTLHVDYDKLATILTMYVNK